jgi:hypothetical protein
MFASSDEYEAELIRERRASGAFRPRKPWRQRLRLLGLACGLALAFLLA